MKRDNHILVVSDNADLRVQIMTDLAHRGVPTLEARNAVNGMTILTQEYPALILLDAMMSGINGIQFCKQMIQYELTSIPVMIMFDAVSKATVIRDFSVLRLAKKGAIQKPFTTDELVKQIEAMLGFLPQGTVNIPEPIKPRPAASSAPAAVPGTRILTPTDPLKGVDDLLKAAPESKPAMVEKSPGIMVQTSLDHRKPITQTEEPIAPKPERPAAERSSSGKIRHRVLVIDDDPDIRLFLKLALEEFYEVASAENGLVGIAMMEQFVPDIIVCDVVMPVMNGLETVEAIRKHPKFKQVPVFFLTGEKHPSLPAAAKEAGGNLFLPKPIDPTKLLHYIEHFIRELNLNPRSREVTLAGHHVGQAGPVRILVIDSNPEHVSAMKAVLNQDPGSRWEVLWSEEPRVALSTLARMEPDLILYNPRQKVMEGIAFAQFLMLKKFSDVCELAFFGKSFEREDIDYSRDHLGRDVLWVDIPSAELKVAVMESVKAAQKKFKAKKYSLDQLRNQQTGPEPVRPADPDEAKRQREMLKAQYKRIQNYIDQD